MVHDQPEGLFREQQADAELNAPHQSRRKPVVNRLDETRGDEDE